jgi:site-specific DNA recombinase
MTIFELASKAHDLFKSSELEEKRRIIALVFPNLEMNAAKLVFTLRKPFDMMMNVSHRKEWLPGKDSNLRPID